MRVLSGVCDALGFSSCLLVGKMYGYLMWDDPFLWGSNMGESVEVVCVGGGLASHEEAFWEVDRCTGRRTNLICTLFLQYLGTALE